MNVLIDGNIILDVLQRREPHVEASSKIWKLCETDQVEGFISALTFNNAKLMIHNKGLNSM